MLFATFTWDGGGADANWSTAANWLGDAAPATDGSADLVFPAAAPRTDNVNDFAPGAAFASVAFTGTGYSLTGNAVALGAAGVLPMRATTAAPTYAGEAVAWWLPFIGLGVVTAAIAYTTGIAASRRLGSRLASFVALLEVVAAVGFAWLLLDQLPGTLQFVGGALILAGVVVVKLGERRPRADAPGAHAVRAPGVPVPAGQVE